MFRLEKKLLENDFGPSLHALTYEMQTRIFIMKSLFRLSSVNRWLMEFFLFGERNGQWDPKLQFEVHMRTVLVEI